MEPCSHLQQVPDSFCKAHRVHGHGHRVGEGKNEPDGAAQLRPEASRDEEVGAPCGTENLLAGLPPPAPPQNHHKCDRNQPLRGIFCWQSHLKFLSAQCFPARWWPPAGCCGLQHSAWWFGRGWEEVLGQLHQQRLCGTCSLSRFGVFGRVVGLGTRYLISLCHWWIWRRWTGR